jgi:hypothetical protein
VLEILSQPKLLLLGQCCSLEREKKSRERHAKYDLGFGRDFVASHAYEGKMLGQDMRLARLGIEFASAYAF